MAFSLTVPLTRIAVSELPPLFVGAGRAVLAAGLASLALIFTRATRPTRAQWPRLAVVAGGIVVGFPVLTSLALTSSSATHGAVVIALLPAATAVVAVVRGRERVPRSFWAFAGAGAVAAVAFAIAQGAIAGMPAWSDLLLLGAVIAGAIGYAEGGLLARELGAWQTVSWALVLASPFMVLVTLTSTSFSLPAAGPFPWLAFGYLGVVSMFLGFFAWYRGLAIGPIATVSQVQLVQPVITIAWAAILLGERIDAVTIVGGLAVIGCAGLAVRVRVDAPRAAATR